MPTKSFLDCFSALEDPRQAGKVVYPLPEILLIVLCGTLAGAENFVQIERWARRKLAVLRRLLPFAHGVPSHDTLNDVINALPAALFSELFIAWIGGLRDGDPEIVALDGKTSRRARRGDEPPLHLLSAWACRQRLVLGQEAVGAKANEITAIPLLLERLELTGALVTIDAIGCQTAIAETIRAKGADYLLGLKDNWPALAAEVASFFATAPGKDVEVHQTTDGGHGRIEVRTHTISDDVDWIKSPRRFPGDWRFADLAMIGRVQAVVERDGKTTTAERYYLGSARLTAQQFARAVRAHWDIENRLHWVLDVVFHDDLMRLRTAHGPANMATIKHAALNLIRAIPDTASLAVRRKTAAWDDDYLLAAIKGAQP